VITEAIPYKNGHSINKNTIYTVKLDAYANSRAVMQEKQQMYFCYAVHHFNITQAASTRNSSQHSIKEYKSKLSTSSKSLFLSHATFCALLLHPGQATRLTTIIGCVNMTHT